MNFVLLLYHLLHLIYLVNCAICPTTEPATQSPLVLYSSGTVNQSDYAHILSSQAGLQGLAAAYGISLTYEYQLTATAVPGPSTECTSDCLTTLTPVYYKNDSTNTVMMSMARPGDVATYTGLGFMTTPFPAIYCVPNEGDCGATLPLYLYFDGTMGDFYVSTDGAGPSEGVAAYPFATVLGDMAATPLCYVWLNTTLTTTTTTTTTTPAGTTTTVSGTTTTTAASAFPTTTYTGPATTENPYWTTAYPIWADSNTTTDGSTTTVAGETTTTVAGSTTTYLTTTDIYGNGETTTTTDSSTTTKLTTTDIYGNGETTTTSDGSTTTKLTTTDIYGNGETTTTRLTTTDIYGNGEPTTTAAPSSDTTDGSSSDSNSAWKWPLIVLGAILLVGTIIAAIAFATVKFIAPAKKSPVMSYSNSGPVMPPQPVQSVPSPQPFTVGQPTVSPPGVPNSVFYG